MAEQEYSPIRVNTLRGDLKIPFDIYIKVGDRYIHYCRSGDSFEGKRLERLKSKKLKKMYIRPEDEIPYAQYMEQNIDAAYDSKSGKSLEVRAEVIQGFQQASAEQFMEEPTNELGYNHVRSSVQRFIEFIEKQPKAALPVLRMQNTDFSVTHHSVSVATLTTLMTLNSKLKENNKLHLLGLGCMLHDIDHFTTEFDLSIPLDQLSKEQLAFYREHPRRGAQRLQTLSFIDQIVMNVILQHEEYINGSGSPKGLFEKEIEPVVLIAATANAYDRLISFHGLSPKEAMKSLMIEKTGLLPLEHLKSLQALLKSLQLI